MYCFIALWVNKIHYLPVYTKTSLTRPTMGPTLNGGRLRELDYAYNGSVMIQIKRLILGSAQFVEVVG